MNFLSTGFSTLIYSSYFSRLALELELQQRMFFCISEKAVLITVKMACDTENKDFLRLASRYLHRVLPLDGFYPKLRSHLNFNSSKKKPHLHSIQLLILLVLQIYISLKVFSSHFVSLVAPVTESIFGSFHIFYSFFVENPSFIFEENPFSVSYVFFSFNFSWQPHDC